MKKTCIILAKLKAITMLALVSACSTMPVGNTDVPEPAKSVDLNAYLGLWYEQARYENRFEKGCEGVTAEYGLLPDGKVSVINSCHEGGIDGPVKSVEGKAKIVDDTTNAKLKVSFFGPFYFGNYWILDHAADYSWSIIGEPSGKYLWLLTREKHLEDNKRRMLYDKIEGLGYDLDLLRETQHSK